MKPFFGLLCAGLILLAGSAPSAHAATDAEHRAVYDLLHRAENQPRPALQLEAIDKSDLKGLGASADVPSAKGKGIYVRGTAKSFPSDPPFAGVALLMSSEGIDFDSKATFERWRKTLVEGQATLVKGYLFDEGGKGKGRPKWNLQEFAIGGSLEPAPTAESLVLRERDFVEKWERITPKNKYSLHLYIYRYAGAEPRLIMRCITPGEKPIFPESVEVTLGEGTYTFPTMPVSTEIKDVAITTVSLETVAADVTDDTKFLAALVRAREGGTRNFELIGRGGKRDDMRLGMISDISYPHIDAILRIYYDDRFRGKPASASPSVEPAAPSPTARTAPPVPANEGKVPPTAPKPVAGAGPAEPKPKPAPESPDSPVIAKLKTYLLDNFGNPGFKTSWYDNMLRFSVQGDTLHVVTDLPARDPKLKGICGGVSGFVYGAENRDLGLKQVKLLGAGDKLLLHRKSVADKCEP